MQPLVQHKLTARDQIYKFLCPRQIFLCEVGSSLWLNVMSLARRLQPSQSRQNRRMTQDKTNLAQLKTQPPNTSKSTLVLFQANLKSEVWFSYLTNVQIARDIYQNKRVFAFQVCLLKQQIKIEPKIEWDKFC